jgi:glutamate transport system substrate-binding protein
MVCLLASLMSCGDPPADDSSIFRGPGSLTVGVTDDAPGFSVGAHNTSGFDIDLMNAIGRALHKQVTPYLVNSADREPALKTNKAAIIIDQYSITPGRNNSGIDFAGPYMVSTQALLVLKNDARFKTKDDLKNKSICTEETTTGADVTLPDAIQGLTRSTLKQCVDQLLAKNTDAVFTDTLLLYGYVNTLPGRLKVVLPGAFGENQYYGVGLLGGHRADCARLNDIIREYLRTQWRHDFQDTLPAAVRDFTGSDPDKGDFENAFKPTDTDITRLSCKL